MALKDDPKVQVLIEKAAAAATKAETKRCLEAVKGCLNDLDPDDDKVALKAAKVMNKACVTAIKAS